MINQIMMTIHLQLMMIMNKNLIKWVNMQKILLRLKEMTIEISRIGHKMNNSLLAMHPHKWENKYWIQWKLIVHKIHLKKNSNWVELIMD